MQGTTLYQMLISQRLLRNLRLEYDRGVINPSGTRLRIRVRAEINGIAVVGEVSSIIGLPVSALVGGDGNRIEDD